MQQLARLFYDICLFRAQPQNVPYSTTLLSGLLIVNLSVSLLQLISGQKGDFGFAQVIAITAITFVFVYMVLALKGIASRFVQTMSSMLGTDLIIMIFALPLLLLQIYWVTDPKVITPMITLMAFYALFLSIWQVMITAYIFRHAMTVSMTLGIVLAFALLGTQIIVFQLFV